MIPPPDFNTLDGYDKWCARHMVEFNRLSVTNESEYERIAIRIEGLLRRINEQQQEAA